jgi:hypothetical protein
MTVGKNNCIAPGVALGIGGGASETGGSGVSVGSSVAGSSVAVSVMKGVIEGRETDGGVASGAEEGAHPAKSTTSNNNLLKFWLSRLGDCFGGRTLPRNDTWGRGFDSLMVYGLSSGSAWRWAWENGNIEVFAWECG